MRATDRTTKEPISTAKSTPTTLEEQPGNQQSGPEIVESVSEKCWRRKVEEL